MRQVILFLLLAALPGTAVLDAEPKSPVSPASAGVEARQKHDAAIKAAYQEHLKAVLAADQQYVAELDAALKQAMARMDAESVRNLDDQRKAALDLLNQHQSETDDSEVITAPELVGYSCDAIAGTTLVDASGHDYTAMLNGSYDWAPLAGSSVLRLTGGYAMLPVGVVSSLNDCTIATWVKLDSVDTWSRIFDFGSSPDVYMFLTPKAAMHGLPFFEITNAGEPAKRRIYSSMPINAGEWTHVAVVLSGNGGILYINGNVAGANANLALHPSDLHITSNNFIGKSRFDNDPTLRGCIDDFRIYSQALSPAQIRALSVRTERHTK